MGCDIHFYVEKRVDGKWVTADQWFEDPDTGEMSPYKWAEGFVKIAGPLYTSRNYDLFAMLANVRNGYGFAGLDTGEGFNPICNPKGMPDDASPEVRKEFHRWDGDGHSHTWHTVAELMSYDWTQKTKKRGFVNPREFLRWKLEGQPSSWAGGIGGGDISILTNSEMEEWILKNIVLKHSEIIPKKVGWGHFHAADSDFGAYSVYSQVEWEVEYFYAASDFLSETMPKLWKIGKPEDVRIIIWFDN